MRIATFNINGINQRLANLLAWLSDTQPDIVCLQEIKCTNAAFPTEQLRSAGYEAIWRGQGPNHGVAILSRGAPLIETRRELPGAPQDTEARYIEAAINGVLVGVFTPRMAIRSPVRSSSTSSPGWRDCMSMPSR